jgi:hypothetical protein
MSEFTEQDGIPYYRIEILRLKQELSAANEDIKRLKANDILMQGTNINLSIRIAELEAEVAELNKRNKELLAYAQIKAGGIHWQLDSRKKVVAKVEKQTAQEIIAVMSDYIDMSSSITHRLVANIKQRYKL